MIEHRGITQEVIRKRFRKAGGAGAPHASFVTLEAIGVQHVD